MSELNPYIVKEHEGDYENTIQYFVTGKPLAEDEMVPDSHGVHPVSPLGFMLREDGTPMVPAEPLGGFSAYGVYETCPTCNGTGNVQGEPCQACGGTGSIKVTEADAYAASYKVAGKYYMFGSAAISFPVLDIHRTDDGTGIFVTVNGLVPALEGNDSLYFMNLTSDDYTPTGLVGDNARFIPDSITGFPDRGITEIVITTDIVFAGTVVEGKLSVCIDCSGSRKKFLTIEDPDSDTLSGIYVLGETEGEPIRKVFNRYGMEVGNEHDTRLPCYEGNGYSDTEVERWVSGKVGSIIHHGCHPSAETGDLRDAGALATWFATCGDVDISGGAGKNAVIVPGFGLGYGYYGHCAGEPKSTYRPDPDDSSERKWLTFGYGTKHNAYQTDVGKTALPLDWPFSHSSDYADETRDNNITLIKDGVLFDDGESVPKVVGGLTRMSRECHVCNGTGMVMEDGRTRPCRNCGATGEEPDCGTCHGTGEWTNPDTGIEETCPDCHGVGFCGGHRYVMDKVHVCLYNDFRPSDTAHGHTAGTTVLKKTFVNLATPITQKDGDSFEVTVSLPNVGMDGAYAGADTTAMKNLSAYYAYVSQPRVYVVSGAWKFSDTKVNFTTKDLLTYDLGGSVFKDQDGNVLPDDTDVRVKLLFDAYRRKRFSVTGKLVGGKIVLADEIDMPAQLLRRLKRSADSDGNIHGSICGAAYVEPNNETLTEAIRTNIGLNAVRNEEGALGKDMGEDGQDTLQEFNKFFTADTGDTVRHHVLFERVGNDAYVPKEDQRQIVATVYPTVTNTFPWALTHRRKMGFLDKLMTMDADTGADGLFARVYRMNRDILESIPMDGRVPDTEYPLDMYGNPEAVFTGNPAERNRLSFIGALLTIVGDPDTVSPVVDAQPVRRAIEAASMLASDFRNARVSRLGSIGSEHGVTEYVTGSAIREDGSGLTSFDSLGTTIGITARNEYESMANAVRLRHLPYALASAGTEPLTGEPLSPVLEAYPYNGSQYAYYSGNPYGYGELDTTSRTEEIPCEVASATGTEVFSMSNSIVQACIKSGIISDVDMVGDLYRSAELHAVDVSDIGDILKPQAYRTGADNSWLDILDAFTKIVSPDNIPVPDVTGIDYSSLFVDDEDTRLPFIMADAYGYYRLLTADEWAGADNFIAVDMPTDDVLALFLKDYVPGYAARLAVRNWDSYRVKVMDGTASSTDTAYLTRMKWYGECDDASRGIYASDAFLVASEFSDMNLNRVELGSDDESRALNCSVPPYSVKSDYSRLAPFANENYPYSNGYIRVFMKFVFSEDAGRWYCVDYRQAPVSYLSPLYGAKALDQTVDGKRLWVRPACESAQWQSHLYKTYEEYRPLDINPELAHAVMKGETLFEPSIPEYSYRPAANANNKCMTGWEFALIPGIRAYDVHVEMDVSANFGFEADNPDIDCCFQGKTHRIDTDEWVWESQNIVCNAIEAKYDITRMIRELDGQGGTLVFDVAVQVPDGWPAVYDRLHIGLRTDYSDGNGTLTIHDLKFSTKRKIMTPYLPVDEGGLGLNAPADMKGNATPEAIREMPHANFWNVREGLRPATGASAFTDIPNYYKEDDMWKWGETGGIMSDAVLWGQFDYPAKDEIEYHIPDTDIPDADLSKRILIYAQRNTASGTPLMDTGNIQVGPHTDTVVAVSYGSGRE